VVLPRSSPNSGVAKKMGDVAWQSLGSLGWRKSQRNSLGISDQLGPFALAGETDRAWALLILGGEGLSSWVVGGGLEQFKQIRSRFFAVAKVVKARR